MKHTDFQKYVMLAFTFDDDDANAKDKKASILYL